MTSALDVHGLRKSYGVLHAVDGVSLSVAPGEILGLVGPNGAGKTTTLRCLGGILRPTEGIIRIAGHDLVTDPVGAKRELAFLPDEPRLFEHLTVLEHMNLVARLYGVAGWEAKAETLLAELELAEKRDAVPSELSRGMKQKLTIACGFLHEPSVVLLDEPLTGLDPIAIRKMRRSIIARAERGAAILLSSHLLPLVEEVCHRVCVIARGKVRAIGTLQRDPRAARPGRRERRRRGVARGALRARDRGGGRAGAAAVSFPSAAAFLLTQSAKNRVKRLVKQPRHLVFVLAGAAYFGMIGAAHTFSRPAHAPTVNPTTMAPWIAPFLLLYLAGVWIFGADIAALGFSEPEVDFFFTAPVTRRALVHYRLVRTILGALVTGVFFAVILRRGGRPIYASVGLGLGLATMALHRICASMTRASLLAHGVSALKRRIVTIAALAAIVIGVALSIQRTAAVELPSFDPSDPQAWMTGAESWAKSHAEALAWLLFPIVAIVRLTMATTASQFFAALPVALGVLAVHYAWAVSTDVAFEEASAEAAKKLAHKLEAMREGRVGSVPRTPPLFRLTALGPPWVALFWKNLVAGLRLPRAQLVVWLISFFVFPFATAFFGPRGRARR